MDNGKKTILGSLSGKKASKGVRFGLFSTYQEKISLPAGILMHLLSKFQTLAIYLMFTLKFLPNTYKNVTDFTNLFVKVFVYSDIFELETPTVDSQAGFFLTEIYSFCLIAICFILVLGLWLKKEDSLKRLQIFWAFLIYLHCLFLIFPCLTFNLRIIVYWAQGKLAIFNADSTNKIIVPLISLIVFIWNLMILIFSKVFLMTSIYPNNSLFSKSNTLQRFDVAEKCILFLIFEILDEGETKVWMLFILSLICSMLRNIYTFYTLPYYNLRVQNQEVIMNSLLTTLCILNLFAKSILKSKHRFSSAAIIFAWALFAPFMWKSFTNKLQSIFFKLLRTTIDKTSPNYILHRIPLYKFYLKEKSSVNLNAENFNFHNLYLEGKNKMMRPYVKENGEEVSFDLNNNEHLKMYFLNLLRDTLKMHNDHWPLRLGYIRLLIEYKYYVQALYFIEQTKKMNLSGTEKISIHLTKSELLNKMTHKYKKQKAAKLNVLKFLESNHIHDKLRKMMLQQIQSQQYFWRAYLHNKVDFSQLVQFSNNAEFKKTKIRNFWRHIENQLDETFLTPYLTYGLYLELVNYRPINSAEIMNLYMRKAIGLERILEKDELSNETLYGGENLSIEISGVKESLGTILECSRSMSMIFGYERDHVLGLNIGIIIPDCIKDKHNASLLRYYETGKKKVLDRTRRIVALTSEGYLLPVFIHVRLNPLLDNKISYIGILKPIKEKKNFFIVTPDGTIDSFTFEFGQELKISTNSKMNIFEICSDFEIISDASNIVAFHLIEDKEDGADTLFMDLDEVRGRPPTPKHPTKKFFSYRSTSNLIDGSPRSHISLMSDKRPTQKEEFEKLAMKLQQDNLSRVSRTRTIQNMDYPTALRLYNKYRDEGAEVRFHCYQQPNEKHPHESFKQIKARIHVENMILGRDWIRIVSVDSLIEKKAETNSGLSSKRTTFKKDEEYVQPAKGAYEGDKYKNHQNSNNNFKEHQRSFSNFNLKKVPSQTTIYEDHTAVALLSPTKNNFGELNLEIEESPRFAYNESRSSFEKRKTPQLGNYQITMTSESNLSPKKNLLPSNTLQITKNKQVDSKKVSLSAIASENEDENEKKKRQRKELKVSARAASKHHHSKGNFNAGNDAASMYGGSVQENIQLKINRTVQEALDCKFKTKKFTFFTCAFVSSMVLIAIILIIQMILAINSFQDISNKNEIINFANRRLDALVFTNFMVRVWYSLIQGKIGSVSTFTYDFLVDSYKLYASQKLDILSTMNHELREAVGLIDEDLQNEFYRKNVRTYEVDTNGIPIEFNLDNTFTAIEKIISRGLKFMALDKYPQLQPNLDMLFFLYNCYNDLLISNEHSVKILLDDLQANITKYQNVLYVVSFSAFFVLMLFLLSSIFIILKMRQGVLDFATFFFRVNDIQVKKIESCLNNFYQALDNDFQDETLFSNVNFTQDDVKESEDQNRLRPTMKQITYKSYHVKNQILVFRLWPLVIIVMGFLIGFSFMKLNNIEHIYSIQTQNVAVGNNLINQNLVVSTSVEMVSENATTTIKNQPILNELTNSFRTLSQTDVLLNKFRNQNGEIDANKIQLLTNISCQTPFSQRSNHFEASCNSASMNQGFTSIININSRLLEITDMLVSSFLNSNRSSATQSLYILNGIQLYPDLITVGGDLNYELWRRVSDDFDSFVSRQIRQTIWLSVLFLILILIVSLIAFPWALFKLSDKDYELKKMLKLVPLSYILKNRWLKTYLMKSSNNILDPLKNIL